MSIAVLLPTISKLGLPPRAMSEEAPVTPVLVSSWTFDETSGQTVADAQSLSAALGTNLERNLDPIRVGTGKSCGFNGSGSKAEASHVSAWLLESYSVVAYVQLDVLPASGFGNNYIICDKDDGFPPGGFSLEVHNDASTVNFRAALGTPAGGAGGYTFVRSTTAVVVDTAYRVVLTVDADNGASIYVDDGPAEDTDATRTQGLQSNTSKISIGAYGGTAAFLDGVLKHVQLYDGVLDQTAIEALPAAQSIVHEDEAPEPADFACLLRTTGALNTDHASLGTIPGGSAFIIETADAVNTRWDMRGSIRSTPLIIPTIDWDGKRNVIRFEGNGDFSGGCLSGGGFICENQDPDLNWGSMYQSSNGPVSHYRLRDCTADGFLFEGVRIHGGWDGIATGAGTFSTVNDVVIRKCAMTTMRDDSIENDNKTDGLLVDDCLFDDVFVLISVRNAGPDGSGRINTFQNSIAKLLRARIDNVGDRQYQFFKLNSLSVRFDLFDNVFAVEKEGYANGGDPFFDLVNDGKLRNASGNTICWLGSGAYPYSAPAVSGFTILTGATAQNFYADAVSTWWETFPGHRFAFDPAAP